MRNSRTIPLSRNNIIGLVLVMAGLSFFSLHDFLLFHSLVEFFSIVIAFGIFIVAWNSRTILNNSYLLFLGIAYLFVGALDLVHTLFYKGMMFSHDDANVPTQLWLIARYLESLSLLLAPLFVSRPLHPARLLAGYFLLTAALLALVFTGTFPVCYVEGTGLTPFKIISEYLISAFLLGAFWMLRARREKFSRGVYTLVGASILLSVGSELAFTAYVSVYGIANIIGHLLKFLSFYLIYKALVETGLMEPYALLFRDLKESEELYRRREEEFRSIFESSAVGMAQVDQTTNRFIRFNKKFCEISGYNGAELQDLTFSDITHPDDRQRDMERFLSALHGKATDWTSRKRYLRKDGRIVWVKVTGTIIRDRQGQPERSIAIIEDITRQKLAEEALQDSERKYRTLFTNMMAAFAYHEIVLDGDGRPVDYIFLEVNHAFEEMTGLARDAIIGRRVTEVIPGIRDSGFDWIGEYGKVALHGTSFHREQYSEALNRWYALSAYSPGPGYFAVLFEDITKRRKADQALREREWQFKSTFDNAAVGISHVSLQGRFMLVNQKLCQILGYSREELLGKTFQEISYPEELAADLAQADRLLRGEIDNFSLEKRYVHRDGHQVWVNLTRSLQLDDEGHPLYFIGIIEDISRRKAMENELRESEEKFQLIANGIRDVIWMGTPDGTRIMYVNPAYAAIWGRSIADLHARHRTFADDIHPDDRAAALSAFPKNPREKWEAVYRIVRPDGSIRWIEDASTPVLAPDGELRLRVGIARDVTDRKQSELDREAYLHRLNTLMQELERSNSDLQEFANIISHDLQEPLRTVASFVQLLSGRYRGKLDDKADTYITFITDATRRMQQQLDDLLSFARLGGGQLQLQPVDLQTVLAQVRQNLEDKITRCEARIHSTALPVVTADRSQMIHLFQNLIANGIKFRGPDKPELRISAEHRDREWVLGVCDNGIGIDPKQFRRIFLVFQRLHGRGEYEGSGIGLAICKKIVERHGGKIWVESTPGRGSCFYFSLPEKEGEENPPGSP